MEIPAIMGLPTKEGWYLVRIKDTVNTVGMWKYLAHIEGGTPNIKVVEYFALDSPIFFNINDLSLYTYSKPLDIEGIPIHQIMYRKVMEWLPYKPKPLYGNNHNVKIPKYIMKYILKYKTTLRNFYNRVVKLSVSRNISFYGKTKCEILLRSIVYHIDNDSNIDHLFYTSAKKYICMDTKTFVDSDILDTGYEALNSFSINIVKNK